MKKFEWNWRKTENIYFLISIILGCLFVIITPPFQVPDETAHFYRANQIAEGEINGVEGDVISSVNDFTVEIGKSDLPHNPENKIGIKVLVFELFRPLNKESKIIKSSYTTHNNSALNYIPQAIGIIIGKVLNFSPYKLLFFSRFVNLLFAIFLTTLAIKICPIRKWSLLFIGLLPMTLSQYASTSPDAIVISFCIFYIGLVMNLHSQIQFDKMKLLLVILLTFTLALIKPGYIFLCSLILLVPIDRGEKKFDLLIKGTIFLATIAIFCIRFAVSIKNPQELPAIVGGVDAVKQFEFVLKDPFGFIRVLVSLLISNSLINYWMFIGMLGWADTLLPIYVYVVYSFSLIIILLFDNDYSGKLISKTRVVFITTFAITFLAIQSIFYFIWTPVGANYISGFQGRYILPIAGLLYISFYNKRKVFINKRIYLLLPVWILGGIISLITVINRYYL